MVDRRHTIKRGGLVSVRFGCIYRLVADLMRTPVPTTEPTLAETRH